MSHQSYFVLRSSDRNKSQNPLPNEIYFDGQAVGFTNSGIRTIEGESVNMFYDIPNINPRNNIIVIDNGVQSFPVEIPTGHYNYFSLAGSLSIVLNTLGLGLFSVSWDVPNNRFSIVAPIPIKITKYPLQRRDLGAVMGFVYDQPLSLTVNGVASDLAYTRDIYIISDTMHRHKRNDDQSTSPFFSNILFVVPVYGNEQIRRINPADPNGTDYFITPRNIYYDPSWTKQIAFNPQEQLSFASITLLDDQGEKLYCRPDSEDVIFRLSLKLSK